jgi:tetratricopeptide (TPR) repeat protein
MTETSGGSLETPLRDLVATARYREALAMFLEADERSEPLSPETQILAATAASRIGEFALSAALAGGAQTAFQHLDNTAGVLQCINLLGTLAFERGNIDDAEARFRVVVELAERANCPRFAARGANNLANIAHLRDQPEHASALYQKALDAYHRVEDELGIAETRYNLIRSRWVSLGTKDALEACSRSVETAERLGVGGLISLTLLGRAELLIERGAFQEATDDIDRAQMLAWLEGNGPHVLESERLRAFLSLRRGMAAGAHERAELIRSRATEAGCALIAAEAASISALALKIERRLPEADAAHDRAIASFRALGAHGLLANHQRAWEETPA